MSDERHHIEPVILKIIEGFGKKFNKTPEDLLALKASAEDQIRLLAPIPALGRYRKDVIFLEQLTSLWAWGKLRFQVLIEYYIALSEKMESYDGVYAGKKIIGPLSDEDKKALRRIGLTMDEVVQAEFLEKFTDQDTAAAATLVKIVIGVTMPHLVKWIDGIHFACTSEDVIGIVTGRIGTELIFGNVLTSVLDVCQFLINFADKHDKAGFFDIPDMLPLPAFSHKQSAEITALRKKIITTVYSVQFTLQFLLEPRKNRFLPLSGKFGGAVGNFSCHIAAYPDIDWEAFGKDFVEKKFGLYFHPMVNQSSPYVIEAHHLLTLTIVFQQLIKLLEDFRDLVSCPAQLFVKMLEEGRMGSSVMPGKTNLWAIEGAIVMLEKVINNITFLAQKLQQYDGEGDMKRSFLMRDIGNDFMPMFIAFNRMKREMNVCVPNLSHIKEFFNRYPALYASIIQTVLKRERYEGDAYRDMQRILFNPDKSYATMEQFMERFVQMMEEKEFPDHLKEHLLEYLNLEKVARPAFTRATKEMSRARRNVSYFRKKQRSMPALDAYWEKQAKTA